MYQSPEDLGLGNETIVGTLIIKYLWFLSHSCNDTSLSPDQNLTLQDELYRLHSREKNAFDEAKALEARWTEVQREKKEVYQVLLPYCSSVVKALILTSAVHTSIPPDAPLTLHNGTRYPL